MHDAEPGYNQPEQAEPVEETRSDADSPPGTDGEAILEEQGADSREQELSPSRIRRNGGARGLDAARRALLGTMLCSVIQDSAGVRES